MGDMTKFTESVFSSLANEEKTLYFNLRQCINIEFILQGQFDLNQFSLLLHFTDMPQHWSRGTY